MVALLLVAPGPSLQNSAFAQSDPIETRGEASAKPQAQRGPAASATASAASTWQLSRRGDAEILSPDKKSKLTIACGENSREFGLRYYPNLKTWGEDKADAMVLRIDHDEVRTTMLYGGSSLLLEYAAMPALIDRLMSGSVLVLESGALNRTPLAQRTFRLESARGPLASVKRACGR